MNKITLWTANYHDGDKCDGIDNDDLTPQIYTCRSDAVAFVFAYVASRIIHFVPNVFICECLNDKAITTEELRQLLGDCTLDQQERYIDWYFEMADESESMAAYSITCHDVVYSH